MAIATQEQPGTQVATRPAFDTVRDLLMKSEASLAAALPKHIPVSYMQRVVLTAVQRTPKLLECYPISLLGAVFQAAQLGLVPDGVLGMAYLVPFKNTDKNRMEVQFIPGYRGLVTLARRSGEISTIDAEVVYEKDVFVFDRGTNPTIEHKPYMGPDDPGPLKAVYAYSRLKDGGVQIKVMVKRDVDKIKKRSASVKSGRTSPWDTDPEWMWKKTALKQLCKLLPVSVETQRALALDDASETELPQDLAMLADPNETATPIDGDVVGESGEPAGVQMPQRMADPMAPATATATESLPDPTPAAEAGVLITNVEPVEFQKTRGKSDEEVARLNQRRSFFWIVTAGGGTLYYTVSDEIRSRCEAFKSAKRRVEITSEKDNSAWPKIVEVVGAGA